MRILNYLLKDLDSNSEPERILKIRVSSLSEEEYQTLSEDLYDVFTSLDEELCFTTPLHKIMSMLPDVYFDRVRDPSVILEKIVLTIKHLHLIDELV
jgi:Fe-S-cluster formation regulator IscX/YfhJ